MKFSRQDSHVPVEERSHKNSFEQLLAQYDYTRPQQGQILQGEVLVVNEDAVIVDVGVKRDAIVPLDDLEKLDKGIRESVAEGVFVTVLVTHAFTRDGKLLASIQKGLEWEDWDRAEKYRTEGESFETGVAGRNRGGLVVEFGTLRGFVPKSHLTHASRNLFFESEKSPHLIDGLTLNLIVIEVDRLDNRLILSEREACKLQTLRRLSALQPGEIIQGKVTSVVDFGAFVDLSGVDGLIHISELDWNWVAHPSEILTEGDEVDVLVKEVDLERGRVSLSRKRLLPKSYETHSPRSV